MKKEPSSAADVTLPDPPVQVQPKLVAALMYDGIARIYANSSEVSIDRLSAVSYRLRVYTATMDDQGLYACHAEAWGQDPHGGWYNTGARAESNTVTVYLYARGKLFVKRKVCYCYLYFCKTALCSPTVKNTTALLGFKG